MRALALTLRRSVVAAMFVAGGVTSAQAAIVSYTSSAAFQAAVAGGFITLEGFESGSANQSIASGSTFNGLTYSFNNGRTGRIDATYNAFGNFSLAAEPAPDGFFDEGDSITVTFGSAVNAFGVFFNVLESPAGSLRVETSNGDVAVSGDSYDTSTFQFVGLVSDTGFTSVTFGAVAGVLSGFNVDNISFGTVDNSNPTLPEPMSLALSGLALLAAGAARGARRPA